MPSPDLVALWEAHCRYEFETRDVDATMATMVGAPYVNHVPTMTGGVGHDQLKRFYKYHFIGGNPRTTELQPISRTVGADQIVDEMLFKFTHTSEVDWMLPGRGAHRQAGGDRAYRHRAFRGRQGGARAYLLGPGVRARSGRPARPCGPACCGGWRRRERSWTSIFRATPPDGAMGEQREQADLIFGRPGDAWIVTSGLRRSPGPAGS